MADPMTPERLAEAGRLIERGHDEIAAICKDGPSRWRMSIPARPDRDSDLILSDALKAGREALAEVERLRAELADEKRRNHYVRAGNAERENAGLRAELAEANHVLTVTGEKLAAVRGQRDRAEAERDEAREQVKRVRALSARLRSVDEIETDALADRIDAALENVVDLPETEADRD